MILYTIVNIIISEIIYIIAEKIISSKKIISTFIITFFIGLWILSSSFGGAITRLMIISDPITGTFNLIDILLLFFNMGYGFLRGLSRIQQINRKYGNA